MSEIVVLSILIFVVAVVFSSVGHGGASGYLAAMALVGIAPEVMRPSALLLNVLVASIGTVRFHRAGHLRWPILLPFAVGSVPLAFVGGMLSMPDALYARVVGSVLLFAAYRLFLGPKPAPHGLAADNLWFFPLAMTIGMAIGLLSGLTGIGGGVFLSPVLLLARWAGPRQCAGVTVAFILLNSIAGISGQLARVAALPAGIPYWAASAVVGGMIGSGLGARRLGDVTLRRLLAMVLLVAAGKLMLT
jgi:hypothetical protein